MEDTQNLQDSDALIAKIANYGFRRPKDFDKHEALCMAEQLAVSARLTSHPKAASYDVIAALLRDKLSCPISQFKAYFSALLADKEYGRILDAVNKVDKAFKTHASERRVSRVTAAESQDTSPRSVLNDPGALPPTGISRTTANLGKVTAQLQNRRNHDPISCHLIRKAVHVWLKKKKKKKNLCVWFYR